MATEIRIGEIDEKGERLRDRFDDLRDDSPLAELFPSGWMDYHTDFENFEAFLAASPWDVACAGEFDAIPTTEWTVYVADHTDFQSWEEMVEQAATDYVRRELAAASND